MPRSAPDRYGGVSDPDDDYDPASKRKSSTKKRGATPTAKHAPRKRVRRDYTSDEDNISDIMELDEKEAPVVPSTGAQLGVESFVPPRTGTSATRLSLRGGGKGRRGGGGKGRAGAPPRATANSGGTQSSHRRATRSTRTSRGASLLVDLESLSKEDAAVKQEIARLGLVLRDVEGDGNCLFRAVSDQLYGDQKRHPELRKLTCDFLESNEQDFEAWVKWGVAQEGESYADYVRRMRKSGQYASEVEVHACARLLKRDIRIVHSDHSSTIPFVSESAACSAPEPGPDAKTRYDPVEECALVSAGGSDAPHTPRRRNTRSRTSDLLSTPGAPLPSSPLYASALADYLPPTRTGRTMLWLALFNNAEHYQSVRRRGDHERRPAEIEDRLAIPHELDKSERAKALRGEIDKPSPVPSDTVLAAKYKEDGPLQQVLRAMPVHYRLDHKYVENVLRRNKGVVDDAIETLLEELELREPEGEDEDTSSTPSEGSHSEAKRVDEMLRATSISSNPRTPEPEGPVQSPVPEPSSSLTVPSRSQSPAASDTSAASDTFDQSYASRQSTPSSDYTSSSAASTPVKPKSATSKKAQR